MRKGSYGEYRKVHYVGVPTRPPIHSQSHQAQNMSKHTDVKQRMAWTREEIKEVIRSYKHCRKYLTGNYKKVYEIW